jgi:hypothetical protein
MSDFSDGACCQAAYDSEGNRHIHPLEQPHHAAARERTEAEAAALVERRRDVLAGLRGKALEARRKADVKAGRVQAEA